MLRYARKEPAAEMSCCALLAEGEDMDDGGFDEIVKAVASSRRKLLRSLAGLVGGGALVASGLSEADAAGCRGTGAICREDANCCLHKCGEPDATGRRRCQVPRS
jgi:hypothetical protein